MYIVINAGGFIFNSNLRQVAENMYGMYTRVCSPVELG